VARSEARRRLVWKPYAGERDTNQNKRKGMQDYRYDIQTGIVEDKEQFGK
jgi:hypothetical protein